MRATTPKPTVQKAYRLEPGLAAAVKKAAAKVKTTENEFVTRALQHACDARTRPAKAKAPAHAS